MIDKKGDLAKIVGGQNVLNDPETLEAYSKDESFVRPRRPLFVVKPQNVDEVQGIVRWQTRQARHSSQLACRSTALYGDTIPICVGQL
jgi:hypothetical protein